MPFTCDRGPARITPMRLPSVTASSMSWVMNRTVVRVVCQMLASSTCISERVCASNAAKGDRKSTRLNSSHVRISYAVFCLKKKKTLTYHNSIDATHHVLSVDYVHALRDHHLEGQESELDCRAQSARAQHQLRARGDTTLEL